MKLLIVSVLLVCIFAASAVKNRFNSRFQRLEQTPAPFPHEIYGPPPQEYEPPPPSEATFTTTTEEIPTTTTEPESETINPGPTTGRLTKGKDRGLYYIYHPDGQLQRVVYSAKQNPRTKTYTTQLKYEDVQPIREPIFTYDPQTGALTRLQT